MKLKDSDLFNCSEEHEIKYVINQYKDQQAARQALSDLCVSKTINRSTHGEVYALLKAKGLEKK